MKLDGAGVNEPAEPPVGSCSLLGARWAPVRKLLKGARWLFPGSEARLERPPQQRPPSPGVRGRSFLLMTINPCSPCLRHLRSEIEPGLEGPHRERRCVRSLHWAIYVGDGYVVHLAPPSEVAGAGAASVMSALTDKAIVKKELLYDVAGSDKYQVNNKHDDKYSPLPYSKIIQRAEELVGQEVLYKLTSENCEHFVNELRYGVARSDQVRDVVIAASVAGMGLAAMGLIGVMFSRNKRQKQ
ncbi:hypothetical protein EGM_05483 [Macaca fascicularis]|uniref:LRAT domain-containing protein n=1 Tax=Macaca fascicularis TaxID=9541 RepID=G7PPS3_MACFA|nr:hypothetical protein EGM_05483 [Macaca fascicularis]